MLQGKEKRAVDKFIQECDKVIESGDINVAEKLCSRIISIFKVCIPNIEDGLDAYSGCYSMGEPIIVNYLNDVVLLKEKLEFFVEASSIYSIKKQDEKAISFKTEINNENGINHSGNSTNTNTLNNIVNIKEELNRIRDEIESDEVLGEEDKEEINEKLDEIESIMDESNSNNDKWKKMKKIISWITTKGYKIGKLIMPLVTKGLFTEE